jgi:hypothetical protein
MDDDSWPSFSLSRRAARREGRAPRVGTAQSRPWFRLFGEEQGADAAVDLVQA